MHLRSAALFILISAVFLLCPDAIAAQEVLEDRNFIRIDQFGYPTNSSKVAVIARAREGYNAGSGIRIEPGADVEVVRTSDDAVVYTGRPEAWNGGSLDEVSGDLGYWFDFTGLTDTGTYRIQLTKEDGTTATSYPFRIADDVYDDVLRTAVEFFYYQRVNQDKTAEYASGAPWTDGPWYDPQEYNVKELDNAERTRSMPKGWFDAGDPNKYVTFATDAVHALLTTYDQYPEFWNDFDLRIPESGDDIPDLLDEVRWETDWLESMQDYDPTDDSGTGGFYQKMGILNDGAYISPPSTDQRDRWYNQICVNSTITGAGMLAHAALSYERAGIWPDKVAELTERAEAAWEFYLASPNKDETCDDGRIEAGDADGSGSHYSTEHVAEAAAAAAYLFALTGGEAYNDFVAANYRETRPWQAGDWGIYRQSQAEAMLFYTTLEGADAGAKEAILAEKTSAGKSEGGKYVVAESDNLYRALPVYFNWGSNSLVSRQASNILDFVHYDLKEDNHPAYQARAQSIISYLHGTNPSGICMLSNMYRYGAELCADEMWHSWFAPGTPYDNLDGDNVGPAPGFLSGGPNPQGDGDMVIKLGTHVFAGATAGEQPDQKTFSVDNYWEYGPWAYNEPAIYYQAAYVKALAHFVAGELPGLTTDVTTGAANDCTEAEDIFTVGNEAGDNSAVRRDGNSPGSSGGASVALFDEGDAADLSFTISETRNYDLAVRVRVGEAEDDNLNGLAGLYTLMLDGDTLDYTYDTLSRSLLNGDTYWGEIVIVDVSLEAGEHELTVTANRDWLKLDRLCWRDPNSIVTPPVPRVPYLGTAVDLPGSIQAENYDLGGPGVAYSDSDGSNNGEAYRPDEAVDIEGSEEDGYSVGWVSENEWLEYTVNVTAAGAYQVTGALASPDGGGQLRVSFNDNASSTTLTLPDGGTGGFSAFDTVAAPTPVFLSVGEQVMRLTVASGPAFNIDSLTFTFDSTATGAGIINYFDDLATADSLLSGDPSGMTYGVDSGVMFIAGDGTSGLYQTVSYTLPDDQLANAVASDNRLYVGARTASGETVNLRIDLVDSEGRHTTNGSVTEPVSGTEFGKVVFEFSDAYEDGGYGGTGCSGDDAPCPVDGSVIRSINFYPEPTTGNFDDTLYIDYISFGRSIDDRDTTGGVPTGIVDYHNRLDGSADAFSGNPNGLTFGVEEGMFFIAGDGTATPYQTVDFRLQENGEPVLADVAASDDLLYLRARTVGGDSVNLRVDLVDVDDYNTTNGGRSTTVAGSDFEVYSIDFAGGYEDGGYGGTGCSGDDAPCAVDAQRIAGMRFYPDPVTGGFNDTLEIDWISFGVDLSTSVRDFAELERLSVFPNPAAEALTVEFELGRPARVMVQLFDSFGRQVAGQDRGRLGVGLQRITLDRIDQLPTGTYYLRMLVDGRSTRAMAVGVR
jgi:hypothetical protein